MTRRSLHSSAKANVENPSASVVAGETARPARVWIDRVCLLLLLVLIPLRTVVSETHTFELARLMRHLRAPVGAQPATTLLIVGLILFVATVVGVSRSFSGRRWYWWTGAEMGVGLLAVAGILSTIRAGQKHLALVGVLDFLGAVVYLLTLRQLLTRSWHARLTLAVVLTTGAMVVTKCAYQHWIELPQTIRYYDEHKADFSENGESADVDAESMGLRHDYEKRLRSGSVTGYYGHPNILGSHLILFIMSAVAVIAARVRLRWSPWSLAAPILIVVGSGVAMAATQSQGAMAACGIAMCLWLVSTGLSRLIVARPRRVVFGLWAGALCATAVFIAVLNANPGVAGRSILFRHMYWQGAWDMMADQGMLGVGADNFGRHFTRYKPANCPEEVQSPHSWVVRLAAEWGVVGLAGFLLLLVGVSLRLASSERAEALDSENAPRDRGPPGSVVLWMGGLGAAFLLWWLGVIGGTNIGYVASTLLVAAMPWVIGFVTVGFDSTTSTRFSDDELGPLLPALCAGLIGFLVHTGIDLALFSGGPATTFFALVAVVLASRQFASQGDGSGAPRTAGAGATGRRGDGGRKAVAAVLGVGMCAALVAYGIAIVRPAARLAAYLEVARTSERPDSWEAYDASVGGRAYRAAVECDTLDGTALEEWIEELIPRVRTVEHVDRALALVAELQHRDPANAIGDNDLCALYLQRFELAGDRADQRRSIEAYRRFVAAYPTSPDRRVYLANLLEGLAAATGDSAARAAAAEELQTALDLDARRIYVSSPNRLSEAEVQQINARIRRLTE